MSYADVAAKGPKQTNAEVRILISLSYLVYQS